MVELWNDRTMEVWKHGTVEVWKRESVDIVPRLDTNSRISLLLDSTFARPLPSSGAPRQFKYGSKSAQLTLSESKSLVSLHCRCFNYGSVDVWNSRSVEV
jgi:hypothetical protein